MKIGVFAMIMIGIIIILNAGGVQTNSGAAIGNATIAYSFINSTEINTLANESITPTSDLGNPQSNWFWIWLTGIIVGSLALGLVASLFTSAPPTSYIKAAMVVAFGAALLGDMWGIFQLLYSYGEIWVRWVAVAIFVPLVVYYFFLLIDFWEGDDN